MEVIGLILVGVLFWACANSGDNNERPSGSAGPDNGGDGGGDGGGC